MDFTLNIPQHELTSRSPLLSVDGEFEFSTRVPLEEKERPGDTVYKTSSRDSLPVLAFKFYGEVNLWWVLYDANASKLLGHPLDLPAGLNLRVPARHAIEMEILNDRNI